MIRIANLSSLYALHPVSTGIQAFAALCDKYSDGCCCCCPGFFTKLTNKAWGAINTLINTYKLGHMVKH